MNMISPSSASMSITRPHRVLQPGRLIEAGRGLLGSTSHQSHQPHVVIGLIESTENTTIETLCQVLIGISYRSCIGLTTATPSPQSTSDGQREGQIGCLPLWKRGGGRTRKARICNLSMPEYTHRQGNYSSRMLVFTRYSVASAPTSRTAARTMPMIHVSTCWPRLVPARIYVS